MVTHSSSHSVLEITVAKSSRSNYKSLSHNHKSGKTTDRILSCWLSCTTFHTKAGNLAESTLNRKLDREDSEQETGQRAL